MNNYVRSAVQIQLRSDQCSKYLRCNANICPLDPDWSDRTYLKGEPVCFYMLEAQKPKAKSHFQGAIEGEIFQAICIVTHPVKCSYGPLRRRLERAKHTGSRMGKAL